MIQAINGETIKQSRQAVRNKSTGRSQWRTDYLGMRTQQVEDRPHIFLVEMDSGGSIRPHFHQVDQFQVFVCGSGSMGRNEVPFDRPALRRSSYGLRTDQGPVLRPLGAHHPVHPRQLDLQHLAVQKQQRGQCLILRRGCHAASRGEVRQERFDLRSSMSRGCFLP